MEIYAKDKGMHVYVPYSIEVMDNLIAFMSKVKSATRCCNDMIHDKGPQKPCHQDQAM